MNSAIHVTLFKTFVSIVKNLKTSGKELSNKYRWWQWILSSENHNLKDRTVHDINMAWLVTKMFGKNV